MEAPVSKPLQWYSQVQAVGDFKGNKLLPDIHHDHLVQNMFVGGHPTKSEKNIIYIEHVWWIKLYFPFLLLFVSNSELL